MNWFKRYFEKMADASSGVSPDSEGGFLTYEGGERFQRFLDDLDKERGRPAGGNDEIIKMKREKGKLKPLKGKGKPFEKDKSKDETHYQDTINLPFEVGQRIRKRRRGLAVKQEYGKVTDIRDGKLFFRWDGQDVIEEIPLTETIFMANEIEKA